MNACRLCVHLHYEEESWEMPHINWWECSKRPAMSNLTSFPFKNTKCQSFKAKVIQTDELTASDRPGQSGL